MHETCDHPGTPQAGESWEARQARLRAMATRRLRAGERVVMPAGYMLCPACGHMFDEAEAFSLGDPADPEILFPYCRGCRTNGSAALRQLANRWHAAREQAKRARATARELRARLHALEARPAERHSQVVAA